MSEILVNTTTTGLQHQPAIAAFRGTHFFVVWADSSDATIKGQIFQANGNKSGGEFVVNTPTPPGANTDRQLPTIANSGQGLTVAWIELAFNTPGPRPHVKLQRFNQDGQKTGPEIQVSTTDVDPDNRPAITGMIDGGFVVTWADFRLDQRIRAQRFGFDGSKTGPEFLVNTAEGFHLNPIATTLVDGNYVIAWRSDPAPPGGGALIFRIFDLAGSPMGGENRPNLSGFGGAKAMRLLDNGRFVITHIRSIGVSDLGVTKSIVEARVFEANGTSSDIVVSASSGSGINSSSPALTSLPGGRFLVAWAQKSAETFATSPSVRAKIFSDSLGSVGQEIQVNTTTEGDRFSVCAATVFGGDEGEAAFVAWVDSSGTGGDASDFAVRGRTLRIGPGGLV